MTTLDKQLRNELARTVLAARALAEEAAGKALHALGVDEPDAPGHLDNEGRTLRRKLRAQARQLGDQEDQRKKGTYEIRRLSEKVAYDHWHRLLFARFLAENDLLISPDHGVGVSLADCEELAPSLGLRDGWEVAAQFAARMLPQIFRADDPAGQVVYAPEDRVALRKRVTDLQRDTFLADDALGWVYQFWQAQRKEEVNASGKKIGADELSPVTQLFTEDYMVEFLLDNTLGAWWAGRVSRLRADATGGQAGVGFQVSGEEEARSRCVLPGVAWNYLRFINRPSAPDTRNLTPDTLIPAAGIFPGWPTTAKELKCLDPCMGSGHFVVALFTRLVALRMAEEGLDRAQAAMVVIRDNLFGLELDPRCTQIAAFNLALAAWKFAGYQPLPPMNLACCGLGISATREEWLALAPGHGFLMAQFYDLFKDAPILGSLINPTRNIKSGAGRPDVGSVETTVLQGLERFRANKDFDHEELGVTAQGITGAFRLLSGQYTLVATNVPYLGRGKQDDVLRIFCESQHPDAKADLATCFIERCLDCCINGGTTTLVTPQNWLFLTGYRKLRQRLLKTMEWNAVAGLGERGFDSPQAAGAFTAMICLTRQFPAEKHEVAALDVTNEETPDQKNTSLTTKLLSAISQQTQLQNPDARFTLVAITRGELLSSFADYGKGSTTGDRPRFLRCFWELEGLTKSNRLWLDSPSSTDAWAGREQVSTVPIDDESLKEQLGCRIHGQNLWGRLGVAVNKMRQLQPFLYSGEVFDDNVGVIGPHTKAIVPAIWAFCESGEYTSAIRIIDKKLNVTAATLVKVPIDLAHWQRVATEKYPQGLPKPHSNDPTQWLFEGHPKGSEEPLQVAVARLLGCRWPRQTGSEFPDCPALGLDGLEKLADADGIVCINAIKGEQSAAERLRALLAAAFGQNWSAKKQTELLAAAGYEGQAMEDWLRDGFFEQHCALFHHRPFIWQIWDGLRDGFSALVNYHKLDRRGLEKLIYTYLGDWITRQKAVVAAGEEGSDAKLAAALTLKASLELILEGEAPHDIFVRWKPLAKQAIGWEPDLNDGVRMNIRPFLTVPDIGKKGAGILRWKPNIKWEKDRGTEPERTKADYPWFWSGPTFTGHRLNDIHLTLAAKRKAQGHE